MWKSHIITVSTKEGSCIRQRLAVLLLKTLLEKNTPKEKGSTLHPSLSGHLPLILLHLKMVLVQAIKVRVLQSVQWAEKTC